MIIEKEYEKLTREDAARLLAESDSKPIPGFVFSDNGQDWSRVMELDGVRMDPYHHFYSAGLPLPWGHCARMTERRVWAAGDTVATPGGEFGIVRGLDEDGDPWVEPTSPALDKMRWRAAAIEPWTPGYGFYHTGERVPDPPEGYEIIPEGEEDECPPGDREYLLACDFHSDWEASTPEKTKAELNGRFPPEHQIRAYARRKKPLLQLREGAYYRRRDGKDIDSPAVKRSNYSALRDEFPWEVGGDWYTNTGSYYEEDGTDYRDLVEEVPDPDPAPKLQIREGARYRRRDGLELSAPARRLSYDHTWTQPWDIGGYTYTEDGHYRSDLVGHHLDLVEEIAPPPPRYVAFDRVEELPDWPVIWLRHRNGNISQITKIHIGHINRSISLQDLFKYYQIAPNRKDWVPAGKEVSSE